MTAPEIAPRILGEDGDECDMGIALLGIDTKIHIRLASLCSKTEVALWLESHQDTFIDPKRWRHVVVATHRGRLSPDMQMIRVTDWNQGVRWTDLKY